MSIQNIGRNLWRVIVRTDETVPETGRPRYIDKRFKGTKAEAQAYEIRLSGRAGALPSSLTLGSYLESIWMPSLALDGATLDDYRYGIRYLEPMHQIRLGALTARDIESAIHALPEGSKRQRAKKTLSAALNAAVRWDMIAYSPLTKARLTIGRGKQRSYEAYTTAEVSELLSVLEGHAAEAVAIVMIYGGARMEEALALDWQDIDLKSGDIQLHNAWARSGSGKVELKGLKTQASKRTLHIRGHGLERLQAIGANKTGAIWPGHLHGHIRPDAAYRSFKRLLLASELRYIPLSMLRHTHGTIGIAGGIDPSILQKDFGHTRLSTTVDRYVRPMEALRKNAADAFADLIDS